MKAFRGRAASPGFANGTVVVYRPPMLDAVERRAITPEQVEPEFERFVVALERSVEEVSVVREQVAADVGEGEAGIFDAHAAMLKDPVLLQNIQSRLHLHLFCVEAVLSDEMDEFTKKLEASSRDYMRELAMDARDVGARLLRHLCEEEGKNSLSELAPDSVIVARDLMPSETIGLDRRHVSGIATERGGPTSHTVILARSLGIPAVTGLDGLLNEADSGTICLLDGAKGTITLDPSPTQRKRFVARRHAYDQSQELMRLMEEKECRLKDGTRIELMGNINQASDVELVREHNLDGVGLYRTELMYLTAHSAPSTLAQSRHYSRAAQACGTQPLTIRTFDFAADKHPAFLSLNTDALELRGLRFALRQKRLFKTQLRAVVRSAKEHSNIRLLFPMVTGWWEVAEALELLKAISAEEQFEGTIPVGAMVETPAAIFGLSEIIQRVDFISIGCNDLAQYTLAMERNHSSLTIGDCALHPSLLQAIQQIVTTAEAASCPVCICGEAASDPVVTAIFVGLGVRQCSVSPARASVVRYALRHLNLPQAKKSATGALYSSPARSRDELFADMPSEFKPILAMELET